RARRSLEAKQRGDAADRLEVVPVADHVHGAAVRKRLMQREVETALTAFHRRSVERAASVHHLRTPARRTLVGRLVRAVLDEEELDATVRRGFERLFPARGGAAVLPGLFAPALEQRGLLPRPPLVDHGLRGLEQLLSIGVRLGRRPADEPALD